MDGKKDAQGFRIANFEKVDALRLDLDHLALGVPATDDADRISLVQAQLIHHLCASARSARCGNVSSSVRFRTRPLRQVDAALVGDELEDTRMRVQFRVERVGKLEIEREVDVQLGCGSFKESVRLFVSEGEKEAA